MGAVKYRLQIRRYRLPLRAPVRTAHGVMTERDGVLVRLEDEASDVGFGEAAPVPGFGGGTADEVEAALQGLGGEDDIARGIWVKQEQLDEFSRFSRNGLPCAGVAVENSLEEIRRQKGTAGQVADLAFQAAANPSLANRAAGQIRSQPTELAGNQTLPVAALLPAGREAVKRIGALGEAGFRVFKWKVGVTAVAEELPLLDDLCTELPSGARLRLDANGAWDRRSAERWLERCAERPVEYVEQPVPAGTGSTTLQRAEDLLQGLAEDFPTPIGLDESLAGEGAVERWLAAGWRGVWVVKPSLLGSAILDRLAQARADVVFSSALETAVGARAALRVAFGWKTRREKGDVRQEAERAAKPVRALGFGVWPLFVDARFDGPYLAPFLRTADVERINVEAAWNALS